MNYRGLNFPLVPPCHTLLIVLATECWHAAALNACYLTTLLECVLAKAALEFIISLKCTRFL